MSHHIGCLAAYLKRVTDEGLMLLLTTSDPNNTAVAPHGGRRGVYTPNPIAAGWPTGGDPVLIDVSCSITTSGMTARLLEKGKRFPGPWVIDGDGNRRNTPPRPGFDRVRLPGERALAQRAEQLEHGVALHPSVLPALALWADRLGVTPPVPLAQL